MPYVAPALLLLCSCFAPALLLLCSCSTRPRLFCELASGDSHQSIWDPRHPMARAGATRGRGPSAVSSGPRSTNTCPTASADATNTASCTDTASSPVQHQRPRRLYRRACSRVVGPGKLGAYRDPSWHRAAVCCEMHRQDSRRCGRYGGRCGSGRLRWIYRVDAVRPWRLLSFHQAQRI
jgi:hypothetical protein